MRKSVMDFNHISKDISEEETIELKRLYAYYHKLETCYKWKHKRLKKIRLLLNMTSIGLTTTGIVAGSITANPLIIACISGPGVIIQGYLSKSDLANKVEHCKFAYTSYKKILTQLRSHLRGIPYNESIFLSDVKVLDDIVTDLCPPISGVVKKYDKIYDETNVPNQ